MPSKILLYHFRQYATLVIDQNVTLTFPAKFGIVGRGILQICIPLNIKVALLQGFTVRHTTFHATIQLTTISFMLPETGDFVFRISRLIIHSCKLHGDAPYVNGDILEYE